MGEERFVDWIYEQRKKWFEKNRRTKFPWQIRNECALRVNARLKEIRAEARIKSREESKEVGVVSH